VLDTVAVGPGLRRGDHDLDPVQRLQRSPARERRGQNARFIGVAFPRRERQQNLFDLAQRVNQLIVEVRDQPALAAAPGTHHLGLPS
jgi:hypothetical protein